MFAELVLIFFRILSLFFYPPSVVFPVPLASPPPPPVTSCRYHFSAALCDFFPFLCFNVGPPLAFFSSSLSFSAHVLINCLLWCVLPLYFIPFLCCPLLSSPPTNFSCCSQIGHDRGPLLVEQRLPSYSCSLPLFRMSPTKGPDSECPVAILSRANMMFFMAPPTSVDQKVGRCSLFPLFLGNGNTPPWPIPFFQAI